MYENIVTLIQSAALAEHAEISRLLAQPSNDTRIHTLRKVYPLFQDPPTELDPFQMQDLLAYLRDILFLDWEKFLHLLTDTDRTWTATNRMFVTTVPVIVSFTTTRRVVTEPLQSIYQWDHSGVIVCYSSFTRPDTQKIPDLSFRPQPMQTNHGEKTEPPKRSLPLSMPKLDYRVPFSHDNTCYECYTLIIKPAKLTLIKSRSPT